MTGKVDFKLKETAEMGVIFRAVHLRPDDLGDAFKRVEGELAVAAAEAGYVLEKIVSGYLTSQREPHMMTFNNSDLIWESTNITDHIVEYRFVNVGLQALRDKNLHAALTSWTMLQNTWMTTVIKGVHL